jgi:hypothetical protein
MLDLLVRVTSHQQENRPMTRLDVRYELLKSIREKHPSKSPDELRKDVDLLESIVIIFPPAYLSPYQPGALVLTNTTTGNQSLANLPSANQQQKAEAM